MVDRAGAADVAMGAVADLETRLAFVRAFAVTSPHYKAMGMELAEVAEGHVVLRLTVQPTQLNADGVLHGGVLPASADGAWRGCH